MKTAFAFSAFLLCSAAVCFATSLPAAAQQTQQAQQAQLSQPAPAKWGPGCNKALLDGEFSLTEAPAMPCAEKKKAFIEKVINEVRGGYGGTMVVTKSPHPLMDTPEFTAFFLRAFAEPTKPLDAYVYRSDLLMSRVSQYMPMIEDSRLDWDMLRAWLLFENSSNTSNAYENRYGTIDGLVSARELLWNYLSLNAGAILKDAKRRAWWITRLTADLEAEGGRPQRRWFLLSLLSAADPKREALEKIPMPEKFMEGPNSTYLGEKIRMRQPHPLDPFLIVTEKDDKIPPFDDALTKIAFDNGLSLTVLGIDPATQPATQVHSICLAMTKWPSDQSKVINQESWSAPSDFGYEWRVLFTSPVGRREAFSDVSFPDERTDGVFFFVFNQRLYVWPKAKMDAAVLHMLRVANLIDAAATADFERRGFAPLKETLVKDRPD